MFNYGSTVETASEAVFAVGVYLAVGYPAFTAIDCSSSVSCGWTDALEKRPFVYSGAPVCGR